MYKLRDSANDVLHGLKTSTSLKNKPDMLEDFNNAIGAINEADLLPLLGRNTKTSEFHRLEIDVATYIRLVTGGGSSGRINVGPIFTIYGTTTNPPTTRREMEGRAD